MRCESPSRIRCIASCTGPIVDDPQSPVVSADRPLVLHLFFIDIPPRARHAPLGLDVHDVMPARTLSRTHPTPSHGQVGVWDRGQLNAVWAKLHAQALAEEHERARIAQFKQEQFVVVVTFVFFFRNLDISS